MSRSYKTEGIVVRRQNFGEADRILTILTKHHGKMQVKAPGVRRIPSRRSAHVELLNLSLFTLYKGSSRFLPIVTEAQSIEEFTPIKNKLIKTGFAYYICELVDRLCPENQENRRAFFLVKETLHQLSFLEDGDSLILDFEKKFLSLLGFLPQDSLLKDRKSFIENILEKKLQTRKIIPLFR